MANEPLQQAPYPATSAAFNVSPDIQALAQWTAKQVVMVFASAAARTSAFSAAGVSPAAGMVCYRADAPGLNKFEAYNSTAGAWRVFGPYRDAVTLGSAAPTVALPNIPTYLKRIEVTCTVRGDTAAIFTALSLRVGGDAGSFYNYAHQFQQNLTNGTPQAVAGTTAAQCGYAPANVTTAGIFAAYRIDLAGWDSPHTLCLSYRSQGGYSAGATNALTSHHSGCYTGTAAYTSLTFLPAAGNFLAGTEFLLTGIE